MITENDALEYEIFGTFWTGLPAPRWIRVAVAGFLARRVHARYARYQAYKLKAERPGMVPHAKPWPKPPEANY